LGELIASKGFAFDLLSIPEGANIDCWDDGDTAHAHWLGVTWQVDAEQTLAALESVEVDWLVVDHYALDARWEMRLAVVVKNILVIDDLADREHECAVLLDQNLGTKTNDYQALVPDDCLLLLGPKYALLRAEFAQWRAESLDRRSAKKSGSHVLVNFGGMDPDNLTGHGIKAIQRQLPYNVSITVVMGNRAPWIDDVKKQAAALNTEINVKVGVSNMAQEMCSADLAIGAAGSTSWERCSLGLPAIAVSQADNQNKILHALEIAGAVEKITSNEFDAVLPGLLQELMQDVSRRKRMSDSALIICDGLGVERVLEAMSSERNNFI
jgi:UDP-2,4-diacetamido-2,4,6-trideoxy-beta-L-altropyranose hydrolase